MDIRLTVGVILWLGLFVGAVFPALTKAEFNSQKWWRYLVVFFVVFAVALVTWRLRPLLYDGEINVDESQVLSQALRYEIDPIPWRSVDGGSGGPLYTWAVCWAPVLGLKFNYFAARITSLLCVFAMMAGITATLGELVTRRMALLLSFPTITLLLVSLNLDYLFYSSEQLPSAIMAWAVFLIAVETRKSSSLNAYLIGVLTGSLPFCKIQAGPAAVYLWAVAAAVEVANAGGVLAARRVLVWLVIGGITVPALILAPVAVSGSWSEFTDLYLRAALSYKSSTSQTEGPNVGNFMMLLKSIPEFVSHFIVVSGVFIALLFYAAPKFLAGSLRSKALAVSVFGFGWILAYSIYRTGFLFPHYTQFLILPCVIAGFASAIFIRGFTTTQSRTLAGVVVVLVTLVQVPAAIREFKSQKRFIADWGSGVQPIGEALRKLIAPGQSMQVWGYAPKFHVFSGIPQATRFANTVPLLFSDEAFLPYKTRMLELFLRDFEKSKPALFVDAPDEFWFPDPSTPRGITARHSMQKEISEIVARDYQLIGHINSTPERVPIMVYKRREGL
jgi:hypothetical protein